MNKRSQGLATIACFVIAFTSTAQDPETKIRHLENVEHKAMMELDTGTVSTEDMRVTTPTNKIVRNRQKVFDMKKEGAKFLSLEREVGQLVIPTENLHLLRVLL